MSPCAILYRIHFSYAHAETNKNSPEGGKRSRESSSATAAAANKKPKSSEPAAATATIKESVQDGAISNNKNVKLVVFTATRYNSTKEVRFQQSIETLKALKEQGLPVMVVDASPDSDVREQLSATGAIVSKQQAKGKKGAAFREAAILASQMEGVTAETWICWQEPEKTDMARHWAGAVSDTTAAVVVPFRILSKFKKTYPIEQFHSEMFSNMYMDSVAATALERLRQSKDLPAFPAKLDWYCMQA